MALVPQYGLWLIGLTTFFSCLAVPVPASLVMISGGAFAAAGDLSLAGTMIAALVGAVSGDQVGFSVGRRGASLLERFQRGNAHRQAAINNAKTFAESWGNAGVFLSRWLFSPLGPYVNLVGGATGHSWAAFTISAATGEAIWVALYTGLGFSFSGQIQMVADFASNITGLLAAAVIALILGRMAFR